MPNSSDRIAARTTHKTSFAEIEALTAELNAKRPRSKTLAHQPRRGRAGSVLMQSIAEESMHIRLCSSTETIRPLQAARSRAMTTLKNDHTSFQVSPCLSEDGFVDWHGFVTDNYSMQAPSALRHPISAHKHLLPSPLRKEDSPTLNDEATWLEAELAECSGSSDDEDDELDRFNKSHNASYQSMDGDEDEYVTPEGSPLLSPTNLMPPPPVEIMGLGIQDASLLLPGDERNQAAKSADSLLEQVVLLEACAQTLRTLSHDEREQATAAASAIHHRQGPCTPERQRSLVVSGHAHALHGAGSRGDFCATQLDSSALFAEASYDATSSPMADNGHGTLRYEDCHDSAGERRASAASYLSTNSTASADLSIASHGSSLLYNAHLAAPAMIRAGSSDTAMSTRPSSIASSYGHELVYGKPPISPVRSTHLAQPATVKEVCETPQPSQPSQRPDVSRMPEDVKRMATMPLPPLPHEGAEAGKSRSSSNASRLGRHANRRKEGTEQPQLPARLDSLDAAVAAAPAGTQLKEEFPQRLLGDWMQGDTVIEQYHNMSGVDDEPAVSVQPVPLHKRIHNKDGTTYLHGLGEIVPPSPDMMLLAEALPAYPAARKRLGLEPASSMLAATDSFVAYAASGMTKPTGSLKSKLSDRLGLSSSSKDGVAEGDAAKKTERKVSDSSLPGVLGRMRKASAASTKSRLSAGGAELPAAWTERISVKRPSFDMRRPSLASLTSVYTHSSSSTTASISTSGTAQSRDNGATLLPSSMAKSDTRSRSSLGFRKMFSTSAEAKQPTSDVTNVQALAASAFASPKSSRRPSLATRQQQRDESFMELSDDEDSIEASSTTTTPITRKDLTKMFGASEVDLSQPMKKEKRWPGLSRSNTTASGGAKKRGAVTGVF